MFDQIIKYINTHPVIFALVVLILLFVVYKLYSTPDVTESFTSAIIPPDTTNGPLTSDGTPTSNGTLMSYGAPTDQSTVVNTILCNTIPITHGGVNNVGVTNPALPSLPEIVGTETLMVDLNKHLLGDRDRLVRFRATINGKNYYLMIAPISQCSNLYTAPNLIHESPIQNPKDCATNVVILIDEDTAMQNLNDYLSNINDKEKVCNFQQNLACSRGTSQSTIQSSPLLLDSSPQTNNLMPGQTTPHLTSETCPEEYQSCKIVKQSPIDFIVYLSNPFTASEITYHHRYLIQGVSGPLNIDTSNIQYYLNQNANANGQLPVNVLCADIFNNNDANTIVELATTKQTTCNNNIIGYDSGLRTRIRFNLVVSPIQLDPNTGRVVTRPFYLGSCRNNTCTFNGANYARTCLFSDMLDPNVLEFEPIIVHYN